EGTIRISDGAFIGSKIKTVTLPVSLRTIGDKAFFGCDSLGTVVFRSYNAPRLEEKYDKNYATYENISYTGRIALTNGTVYEGLGVVKYYMWNYGTLDCCYFFGANFVDYIGRIGAKMTMVKPKNGENYDTFIMDCYFDRSFIGAAAPMQATVAVVDLINAIPAYVTLDAESLVLSARNAYEALPSIEQKSLVENYGNLLEAEETIEYLKNRDNPNPGDSGDPSGSTDPGTSDSTSGGQSSGGGANGDPISFGQFLLNNLFGLILAVLVGGAFVAYVLITKKKS
ncbi:MAG: leucine-rich repeat protein, partial [Clostridia bacterium]|nr:leucine-rich repeat protein [Clostridia bacterium]